MLDRWNDTAAAQCANDLALRAYTSRLLGADSALVLHGGGNTSVKIDDTLWVKGSGRDLAQVTETDFTPLWLAPTQALLARDTLSNQDMMAALTPLVREPGRSRPSIETLLHANLPYRFVEHTHADAILAVTNTVHGEAIAARVFGGLAPCAPFRQSGFDLAKACMQTYERMASNDTIGLILLQHGVFAFGESAQASYRNMIRLVERAEGYLRERDAWELPAVEDAPRWSPLAVARLRRDLCLTAGFPLLAAVQDDAQTLAFARRADLDVLLEQGPATPQHAVFIKRLPLCGSDVAGYAKAYQAYVGSAAEAPDPAPRVVLDPAFGALVAGYGVDYLGMAQDIFRHGREIMTRASAHDRYHGLPPEAILEAEIQYGGFERRLRIARAPADRLRGLCIAVEGSATTPASPADAGVRASVPSVASRSAGNTARDNDTLTGKLASRLAAHGAAIVDPARDDARAIVARYGGVDALICSAPDNARYDTLHTLLDLAPFGGQRLSAALGFEDILNRLTPHDH